MNNERPVKPYAKTIEQLLDQLVVSVARREHHTQPDPFNACLHQVAYLVNRLHYECTSIEGAAGEVLRDWDRPEDHEVAHAKCEVTVRIRRILNHFEDVDSVNEGDSSP